MDRPTKAPAPSTRLEGKRIRLEPLTPGHGDALAAFSLNPALWRWTQARVDSRKALDDYIRTALAQRDQGQGVPFAVIDAKTGRPIGSTRYMNIDVENRRLEIGWTWIDAPLHGTGINPEMKYLMLRHAFEDLGFLRVEFKANGANAKSRAALRKLGAKEEGVFRKWRLGADGQMHDTAWYSILADEWPAVRATLESRLAQRKTPGF